MILLTICLISIAILLHGLMRDFFDSDTVVVIKPKGGGGASAFAIAVLLFFIWHALAQEDIPENMDRNKREDPKSEMPQTPDTQPEYLWSDSVRIEGKRKEAKPRRGGKPFKIQES